jgi:hypothetical protein
MIEEWKSVHKREELRDEVEIRNGDRIIFLEMTSTYEQCIARFS